MLEALRADLILVVEDVHETSEGIERLLKADRYRVALARDEVDAIESAKAKRQWRYLTGGTTADMTIGNCGPAELSFVAVTIAI